MFAAQDISQRMVAPKKKLRSACDNCHQGKVKCSGGNPCEKCQKIGFECYYSTSNRIGRPKNTRNKKTMERIRRFQEARQAAHQNLEESLEPARIQVDHVRDDEFLTGLGWECFDLERQDEIIMPSSGCSTNSEATAPAMSTVPTHGSNPLATLQSENVDSFNEAEHLFDSEVCCTVA